ncbi:hypothetical protein D9M70_580890 [compost metagenome]
MLRRRTTRREPTRSPNGRAEQAANIVLSFLDLVFLLRDFRLNASLGLVIIPLALGLLFLLENRALDDIAGAGQRLTAGLTSHLVFCLFLTLFFLAVSFSAAIFATRAGTT